MNPFPIGTRIRHNIWCWEATILKHRPDTAIYKVQTDKGIRYVHHFAIHPADCMGIWLEVAE